MYLSWQIHILRTLLARLTVLEQCAKSAPKVDCNSLVFLVEAIQKDIKECSRSWKVKTRDFYKEQTVKDYKNINGRGVTMFLWC